jgi:hypothetical protein
VLTKLLTSVITHREKRRESGRTRDTERERERNERYRVRESSREGEKARKMHDKGTLVREFPTARHIERERERGREGTTQPHVRITIIIRNHVRRTTQWTHTFVSPRLTTRSHVHERYHSTPADCRIDSEDCCRVWPPVETCAPGRCAVLGGRFRIRRSVVDTL